MKDKEPKLFKRNDARVFAVLIILATQAFLIWQNYELSQKVTSLYNDTTLQDVKQGVSDLSGNVSELHDMVDALNLR